MTSAVPGHRILRSSGPDVERHREALANSGLLFGPPWTIWISSRRCTVGFAVGPGGSVELAVPEGADPSAVVDVVRKRSDWLARTVARHVILTADHPSKEIVDGENFPFLGRNHRLRLIDSAASAVSLTGNQLFVRRSDPQHVVGDIIGWYRDNGREWLADHVDGWAHRFGVVDVQADVRDLANRWGVRDPDGTLALHWALFQLTPQLAEFVLVHELTHFAEPRHGPRFERALSRVLPDHKSLAEELAAAGCSAWLGVVRLTTPPGAP